MATYRFGSGNDVFGTTYEGDWTGTIVFAGAGADTITLGFKPPGGFTPYAVNYSIAFGEAGNDTLSALGTGNWLLGGSGADLLTVTGTGNSAFGESGNDHLIATGYDYHLSRYSFVYEATNNQLIGGAGNDLLESHSTPAMRSGYAYTTEGVAGTIMTGGPGHDSFLLRNTSDLIVANDADGTISQGDILRGVIDEITDYQTGEQIDIGAPTLLQQVTLSTGPQHIQDPSNAGTPVPLSDAHKHPVLADGTYAAFRGDITGPGEFVVGTAGHDLLVVYDTANGVDAPLYQGAVALHGITDVHQVLFA